MNHMWIEPVRGKSIPSPGASDERPSSPRIRVHGFRATTQRSQTLEPSRVFSTVTTNAIG